jgi:hypothetical protein
MLSYPPFSDWQVFVQCDILIADRDVTAIDIVFILFDRHPPFGDWQVFIPRGVLVVDRDVTAIDIVFMFFSHLRYPL